MKVGFRTPNIKKSIKARTTGKIKRKIKGTLNPLYGNKGMGFIKNPEKSIKNSIYHKTSFGVSDIINTSSNSKNKANINISNKSTLILLCCLGFIGLGGMHDFYLHNTKKGLIKLFTLNWFMYGTIIDLIRICCNNY